MTEAPSSSPRSWWHRLRSWTMRDQALHRRFLGGAWWMTLGGLCSNGASLITAGMLLGFLGVEQFGKYSVLASTLAVVLMLAGPSLSWTASKYVAELATRDPQRTARVITLANVVALGFSAFCALGLFLGASPLGNCMLNVPGLERELRLAALVVLLIGLNGAQRGVLSGFQAFRAVAAVNAVYGGTWVLLVLALAPALGIAGAILAQCGGLLAACGVGAVAIHRQRKLHGLPSRAWPRREDMHILKGFALPAYLLSIVAMLSNWAVSVLVVRLPNGLVEMGIFGITQQLFLACVFIPSMAGQTCLPLFSEMLGKRPPDLGKLRRLLQGLVLFSLLVAIVESLAVLLAGQYVLARIGREVQIAPSIMIITLITAVVAAAQGPLNYLMNAHGDMWLALKVSLLGMLLNLSVLIALRPAGGAWAATWGRLISYLGLTVILVRYVTIRISTHRNQTMASIGTVEP